MNLKEFIEECRKRTIFRTISIYAVSSWLIIQIAATTFPFLGLPEIAVTVVIICVLFGLPIMMGFSWYYSIGSEKEGNLILRQDKDNPNVEKNRVFKKIYFSITAVVFVAVVIFVGLLVDQNDTKDSTSSPVTLNEPIGSEEGRIIIQEFENKTADASLSIVGEMAADRIEHAITQNKLATVVSNDAFADYVEILKNTDQPSNSVYDYLSIDTRIIGNYYVDGDTLLFDCSVVDPKSGEVIDAIRTIKAPKSNPLEAIDKIKDIVMGYVATKSSAPHLFIESHTPKYEAYKYFLMRNEDPDNQMWYVEKAIEIDPDYFEPKLIRLSYLYNDGEYEKVDSMFSELKKESLQADDRQKNLLSFYNALLEGNNRMVYNYYLNEYRLTPLHLPSNSTMMVLALQYVNRPEEVLDVYDDVPKSELNVSSCSICHTRSYVYGMALFQLERYSDASIHLENLIEIRERIPYLRFLAKSYVRLKDWQKLDQLINLLVAKDNEGLSSIYASIGKECLLIDQDDRAVSFFERALLELKSESSVERGELLFYLDRYQEALDLFEALIDQGEGNIDTYFWAAVSALKSSEIETSKSYLEELSKKRDKYDYGSIDYMLARYQAIDGQKTEAFSFLRKAVSNGITYQSSFFSHDPFFRDISDSREFDNIMTYWQ